MTMYLDFAEDQARRKKTMHMSEWVTRLDAFLQFNERDVLTHAGAVSHQLAEAHALRSSSGTRWGGGGWRRSRQVATLIVRWNMSSVSKQTH